MPRRVEGNFVQFGVVPENLGGFIRRTAFRITRIGEANAVLLARKGGDLLGYRADLLPDAVEVQRLAALGGLKK